MKLRDADILLVPGYKGSGEDHWQSRWAAKFTRSRRVAQADWHKPVLADWMDQVIDAVDAGPGNTVIVAHSLGCATVVQAVAAMNDEQRARIKGAFFVAPPDVENAKIRPRHLMTFGPAPREPLPFPSVVVASSDDPFCEQETAADLANAWGSHFVDARESGHINSESGHGPWPDGMIVFAQFLSKL